MTITYPCDLDTVEVEVDPLDLLDSTQDSTLDSNLDSNLDILSPNPNPGPLGYKQQIQNKMLKEPISSWMNLKYDT